MTGRPAKRVISVVNLLGPILSGRTAGELLRRQIEELARQQPTVIVDFIGVELATPGFADEFFAKMPPSLIETGRVQFAHVDDDLGVLRDLVLIQRDSALTRLSAPKDDG